MPRIEIAHIQEQGVDIIIVPMDDSFEKKSEDAKYATLEELQRRATGAGLAGKVVPVWKVNGQMKFMAPPNWHAFFQSIDYSYIASKMNKYISWQ